MAMTTREDFTAQHGRDLALIESLRERLAAARALHNENTYTGTCKACGTLWPCETEEALS